MRAGAASAPAQAAASAANGARKASRFVDVDEDEERTTAPTGAAPSTDAGSAAQVSSSHRLGKLAGTLASCRGHR